MDEVSNIRGVTPGGDSGNPTRQSRTPFPDLTKPNNGQAERRAAQRESARPPKATPPATPAPRDAALEAKRPESTDSDSEPYKGIDLWV